MTQISDMKFKYFNDVHMRWTLPKNSKELTLRLVMYYLHKFNYLNGHN